MPIRLATRTKTYPTTTQSDLSYGVAAIRRYDAIYPDIADLSAQPVMVFIHGGGWVSGSKSGDSTWIAISPLFARLGYVCYSINYTLANMVVVPADGTRFPVPQQDCRSFLGYLGGGGGVGLGNGDVNKITMWGNSSGSQMALLMALAPKATFVEAENPSTNYTVVAALTQCSPTDLLTLYNTSVNAQLPVRQHLGFDPNSDTTTAANASPDHYVGASSLPIYLQQGATDPVVVPAQTSDMAATYASAGATMFSNIYAGVGHSNDAAWNTAYNYVFTARQNYTEGYGR